MLKWTTGAISCSIVDTPGFTEITFKKGKSVMKQANIEVLGGVRLLLLNTVLLSIMLNELILRYVPLLTTTYFQSQENENWKYGEQRWVIPQKILWHNYIMGKQNTTVYTSMHVLKCS